MPTVSVIIPVYNVEKYLTECLDSVLAQTLKDIEIICVNDGSTDNCGKILDEYAAKDNRMKVIHQENKGTHLARKAGIAVSTGDYVMFLDSDDAFVPEACETAQNAIYEKKVDILQFGVILFHEDATLSEQVISKYDALFQNCGLLPSTSIIQKTIFSEQPKAWWLCGKIFKGDSIRNAQHFVMKRRLIVGEDAYVFLLTAWFSHSMDYIDDKLYLYRYGVGITAQEENMKKFVRMANDLQIIPALYAFAEEQKHEGHDVSDFLEAVNYFCRYELKICLDGIYYTSSCLEAKKNILSYCIQYTPEETAQELASLLTKQKAELDKAYRDIDNLQERFDVLSHTKAVRFAHFINHLLHRGETE